MEPENSGSSTGRRERSVSAARITPRANTSPAIPSRCALAKAPSRSPTCFRACRAALHSIRMKIRAVWAAVAVCGVAFAREPVRARHAMVVAQEPNATDAGVAVLKSGGNAVDAAVAVGFALAVTHPTAGNIGGGGFMLVRMADGRTTFIDFREKAPAAAAHDMYLDASGKPTRDSLVGWRASGVPGTVRGLEYAHKKFGTKKWSELLDPAVKLASNGFPIPYSLAESLRPEGLSAKTLAKFPDSKRIFLGHDFGDNLIQ